MKTLRVGFQSAVHLAASVAMIVAASVVVWNSLRTTSAVVSSVTRGEAESPRIPPGPVSLSDSHVIGAETARHVVIEFADFRCRFCIRVFKETLPELKTEYVDTGKVRFVFRHLPLQRTDSPAMLAALAAECAGRENTFWTMHDSLFRKPGAPEIDELVGTAVTLGINGVSFRKCLSASERRRVIERDVEAADAMGISGTPTFLLGVQDGRDGVTVKRILIGAQPVERFRKALDELLESGQLQP